MIGLKKRKGMTEKTNTDEDNYSAGKLLFKEEYPSLDTLLPQAKLVPNPNKSDIMNFKMVYTPDSESYWYGGKYEFTFSVPDKFPFDPPKVMCLTKIYHPNIDYQGNVCLNILRDDWKPTFTVSSCVVGVYYLFVAPNPNDPLNHEAANVMRENLETFKSNVKKTLRGGYCFGQNFSRFTRY